MWVYAPPPETSSSPPSAQRDPGAVEAVGARGEVGLDADDRLDPGGLGLLPEVVGAEHVAVVGHRQRRHAHPGGLGEQVVEPGRAVEHGVLGVHVQVHERVAGSHAGRCLRVLPCSVVNGAESRCGQGQIPGVSGSTPAPSACRRRRQDHCDRYGHDMPAPSPATLPTTIVVTISTRTPVGAPGPRSSPVRGHPRARPCRPRRRASAGSRGQRPTAGPAPPLPGGPLEHTSRRCQLAGQTAGGRRRQELREPALVARSGAPACMPAAAARRHRSGDRIEAAIAPDANGAGARRLGGVALARASLPLDGRTGARRRAPRYPSPSASGRSAGCAGARGLDVDRSTLLRVDTIVHRGVRGDHPGAQLPRRHAPPRRRRRPGGRRRHRPGRAARLGQQLADALTRLGRHPGVPQARLAVRWSTAAPSPAPESRLRYVWVVEAGLPVPLVNPQRRGPRRTVRRRAPTCSTRRRRPSASTTAAHHRDLRQHTADNAREEDLEDLNLEVTRSTALDLWPHRRRLVPD